MSVQLAGIKFHGVQNPQQYINDWMQQRKQNFQ